jgi:SAM-dependent methyltransferase
MPAPHGPSEPSPWAVRFAALVPPAGAVLDLACGAGRHARLFLARGHPVTAVDIDISGVADLTPPGTPLPTPPPQGGRGLYFESPLPGRDGGHRAEREGDRGRGPPSQRPGIEAIAADLEHAPWPLAGRRFAGVIVTNYLWRPILPEIVAAVAEGGALIYETFALGNERFGKPANPDFLLRDGELLEAVRGKLAVVAYECLEVAEPRPARVQRIAAVRRE